MAVVSRIATLRFDNGLGSFRQWQATAAAQDIAEGGTVVITTVQTSGGTPPGAADTLTLRVKDPSGATIATFPLTPGSASQTSTFHFTDTGAGGGSPRHGTVLIDIQATRTSLGTYDYETDGSPSTAPTGFSATTVDRGWVRGTTTLVEALSNVALGGAKVEPAEYDESLFLRCSLGSLSYVARALAVSSSHGSLSGNTNTTTATTRDISFANVCDDRFPAADTQVGVTVTAPNEALTGQPYTAFSSTTDDTIDVDPRLTRSWHFQLNTQAFTLAAHDPSFQMLAQDVGQVATRFVTARTAAGVNGLSVTQTQDPTNPGSTVSGSSVTATRDGQAGWTDLADVCPTGKPGGAWVCAFDITAPTDIDHNDYVVGGSETITVLAQRPNLGVIVGGGVGSVGAQQDHWKPGDSLLVGVGLYDNQAHTLVAPDLSPSPHVLLGRFRSDTGVAEYLDENYDWQTLTSAEATQHELTASPADGRLFTLVISGAETGAWTQPYVDCFVIGVAYSGGTPYFAFTPIAVLSGSNSHAGYAIDPLSFAKVYTR